jgi:hypothetical protein
VNRSFFNISLLILVCIFTLRCANPVTPTGGPKDVTPPVILNYEPEQNSKNFTGDRIKITFNEFIQLKDITSQVIISPPLSKLPEFKLRGKSLIISLQEPLKENSTYNFFLGNAIVDLTENNPLENFQYVISSGNVIDSLSVSGSIFNAFDVSPVKGVAVMLYTEENDTIPLDSLPYLVKPYYITKTDASGNFVLNNLSDRPFKLFALNDQNSNLIYDQPGEKIAFIDSLIRPAYIRKSVPDSISADSLTSETADLLLSINKGIRLPLFEETDSTQRLIKAYLANKNLVTFSFKRPVVNPVIVPLNIPDTSNFGLKEINASSDTVNYWIRDISQDTIKFLVSDNGLVLDTASVAMTKKIKTRKQDKTEADTNKLMIKSELKGTHSELYEPFVLTFDVPVVSYNTSKVRLFEQDSIQLNPEFSFINKVQRRFGVNYKWQPERTYKIVVYDSAFFDMLNRTNDTLAFTFTPKTLEDYGNLFINLQVSDIGKQLIVQLLLGEKVIKERLISNSNRISILHLAPGDYSLKAIFDSNNNGKWDTGDYYYKLQPEKVEFFKSGITVRANWDVEEDWEL